MKRMLTTIAAVAAIAGATGAAQAVTLDFDSGTAVYSGPNNLTGYSQDGYEFAIALVMPDGRAASANLFDTADCRAAGNVDTLTTNCVGNDDGDLVPLTDPENGVGGNVLIRQENPNLGNGSGDRADDATGDGAITFTLLASAEPGFLLTGFSGVDDGRFTISVDGLVLGELAPGANRATAATTFANSPVLNVGESFTVNYFGSGGVDSITIAPVPLPAALPMLAFGLGGLAYFGRRRSN